MSQVITFLAKPPPGVDGGSRDGNRAVEITAQMMEEAIASEKLGYTARLERVAYVGDIARTLVAMESPPQLIQIIGHGSPGRIELGDYWQKGTRDSDAGTLDSSPDSYGMLADRIWPETVVLLLGCSVGANEPSGFVASGRALMFDLEDMLDADVYAADELVTPAHFRDGFLYEGSLATSSGKAANPVARFRAQLPEAASPPTDDAPPVTFHVAGALSAPALGFPHSVKAPMVTITATPVRPRIGPLLAMTELVLQTDRGDIEMICAGKLLRGPAEDGTIDYYEFEIGRGGKNAWLSILRDAYVLGPPGEEPPPIEQEPGGSARAAIKR